MKAQKNLNAMFLLASLLVAPAVVQSQVPAGQADDEAALRGLLQQMEEGWNTLDGATFAAPFAENADYVVINGLHLKGRQVIAEGHQQILDTNYKDSHLALKTKSIRFLRPDVAVAHVTGVLQVRQGGQEHTNEALMTLVLTKEDGTWQIDAFQNTGIQPPQGQQ